MEENDIIKDIISGNKELFVELVKRYQHFIYNLSYWLLKNKSDAEDVVQEVFIKLYFNIRKFNFKKSLKSWLYTVTINLCKDKLRKKKVTIVPIEEMYHTVGNKTVSNTASSSYNPAEVVERERSILLTNCINSLPEKYRKIFIMHYFENTSYQKISEITKMPYNTVRVYIFRARKILYKKLKHL